VRSITAAATAGQGFEPRFSGPEPDVLPLDDPAIAGKDRGSKRGLRRDFVRPECKHVFVKPRAKPGATRAEVGRLIAAGLTYAEIAKALRISKPTVSYHARKLGIPATDKFSCRYDWAAVQAFYDAGNSITACQLRFGFARRTFMDAVRRGDVQTRPPAAPIERYLVAGRVVNRTHLKRRLLAAELKTGCCEICGISEWRKRPLSLALHHVNGDGFDNRLENLQLLCPNCHAQTPNFSGRNIGRSPLA
jgi:DNA-binding transcriptional ArsR family regulator